ncbi:hypothetical protein BGX38DRAFT_1203680 [Terfezia claveryi]|nr:hypothetical protein BGX38DRAFT_1203680 [Terfezia claveryi]
MPRRANYTEIERLRLPVIGKFGHVNPADYDLAVVRLHMYEYYNISQFLYFRFDEKNWILKKAIHHYNQEWAYLAIPLHQAIEAKWVFFRVRDNTLASFMTGLREVIELWLSTFSGVKYQDQYRHQRRSQLDQVRMATAAGNLAPNLLPICIMSTFLLRGPGEVSDEEDQFEPPVDAGDRVHNRFLPFFLAFRYNLQFVHEDILESWDQDNMEGNPPVPLFAGLTMVVKKLAPKMLIYVLENCRQQWATSGLHNELATTTDLTMDKPEAAIEPFANTGMGGVRANYFSDLDMDERSDRVCGQPVRVDGAADAAWDGALSW